MHVLPCCVGKAQSWLLSLQVRALQDPWVLSLVSDGSLSSSHL